VAGDGDGGGEGVVSPSTRSVVHAAAPIAMRKSVREAAVIANEARKKITGDGTKRPQRVRTCILFNMSRAQFLRPSF
jgi:hypothetical protein